MTVFDCIIISDTVETCGVDCAKPPVFNDLLAKHGLFFVIMSLHCFSHF